MAQRMTEETGTASGRSTVPTGRPDSSRRSLTELDRGQIVAAAIALIDRSGIQQFSVRKLAGQLGVQPTALSRTFSNRNDLLDAIVDALVDELLTDTDTDTNVGAAVIGWQEYLQYLAHAVRRLALRHPQVFPLIATRPPAAPWLHPPLRSLRWTETFLDTLHRAGFSDRAAVAAFRSFSSFLLGHLLLEVSALGADTAPIEQPDPRSPRRDDLSGYPRLAAMKAELTGDYTEEEFEEALESLLDRLETQGTT